MKCCRLQVYVAGRKMGDANLRIAMTYDMTIEMTQLMQAGYEWLWQLAEPMGIYPAYQLVQKLKTLSWLEWGVQLKKGRRYSKENVMKKLMKWLKKEEWLKKWGVEVLSEIKLVNISDHATFQQKPDSAYKDEQKFETLRLASLLRGRNLYLSEILYGLKEMGFTGHIKIEVKKSLIALLVADVVEIVPANLPSESLCLRCGHMGLKLSQCGICGQRTWYCPECQPMGESITCRPIFRRADQISMGTLIRQNIEPYYHFSLSTYQERLSRLLLDVLKEDQIQRWLLWAVCGAGKTETTFALIAEVLKRGGRVLFTSPRREVVRQMVERMENAFLKVSIVGLYGGSENKFVQSQLTVATVHQLVRFYQAFDLIIFDEVDAFPYQGNQLLKNLLELSLKKKGRLIFLSATPDEGLLNQVKAGQVKMLTLPARFHRKEVPVPLLRAFKLPICSEYDLMPSKVRELIFETIYGDLAQLYIFLPTRRMVEIFGQSLHRYNSKNEIADWIQYTHSQDQERSLKVGSFLRGDYPILVTTTILERGVTVPKSNVLVLYADREEIFRHQNLVQMAGRGGRSVQYPEAKVWFIGSRISEEMKKAREWIVKMNEEAKERGLLDVGIS